MLKITLQTLIIFSIIIDLNKIIAFNTRTNRLNNYDLVEAEPFVTTTTTSASFLLFTNSVNKHQASKHRSNKNSKKKSSNRNRAAVHKTTTIQQQSTTVAYSIENEMPDESDLKRQFNLPEHINVTVKVGESVILNCAINSSYGPTPGVIWMQGKLGNVLSLDTNRITVDTRFEIIQQPLHMTSSNEFMLNNGSNSNKRHSGFHHHRLRHHNYRQVTPTDFNYYHLRISNVQIDDENEYACESSVAKQNEEQSNVHALFNLQVTQSPGFIEQLTSETNNALFEYSDTVLKCFATGKPAPKIRWYQITEENEILKDLFHESTTLSIKNVSKYDPSRYECVASNGILPSVSKKFSITVYYSPTVIPLNQNVYQTVGQSVLLGCLVNSNPESTVIWYKKVKNLTNGTNDFELIDINHSRYQTHKFKQTNQTVYYFKIKYLDTSDYTVFKCEVTNLVGKNEAVIEILDLQDSEQSNTNNEKATKKNQSISYVLNNPFSDESDKPVESDNQNDNESQNEESDEFRSKDVIDHKPKVKEHTNMTKKKHPTINMRKNNNNNSNNNKTFHKYQINKSNSIQESENSLQRINDILENGSASSKSISFRSKFVYLLLLILNLIYCAIFSF